MAREVYWSKILLVFLIATLLFSLGILGGYIFSLFMRDNTLSIQEDIKNQLLELQLQKEMIEKYPCSETTLNRLTDKMEYLGGLIDILEKRMGFENADAKNMKTLYTLLELNHYLLMQKRAESCNETYIFILFFYSNEKQTISESQDVGRILGYIRNKYDNSRVYSFDSSIRLDSVDTLRDVFKVKKYPSVVVGNVTLTDVKTSEDVERYILI